MKHLFAPLFMLPLLALTACGLPAELTAWPGGALTGGPAQLGAASVTAQDTTPVAPSQGPIDHMPFPLTDFTGAHVSCDPANVLVVATPAQFHAVFLQEGWVVPQPLSVDSIAHFVEALVLHERYPDAPLSTQYDFGRPEDQAFEKNCIRVNARDHFRAWQTSLTADGKPVWLLACTRDARIGLTGKDHLPDHIIAPDVDTERDLVVGDLVHSGQVASVTSIVGFGPGYHGHNANGDPYYTDGSIKVVVLK